MKITVSYTLDVDRSAWSEEFGIDPLSGAAVRADVQRYFMTHIQDAPAVRDLGIEVTSKLR